MKALPTVRQLQYFLALAEHEHFGRAANACHVSQSAFSHAIAEFEKILGTRLVDRTRRSVTITNAGRDAAVQARLCLQDIEALVQATRVAQRPLTGALTLGVIPTIAPFVLPRVLTQLRRQYPQLELYLREQTTSRLADELRDGSVDVVLLALPWALRNVETIALFDDPFHLAFHRKTKLVDPKRFAPNRLVANSVLLLEDGHCLRDHTVSACRIRNLNAVNRFAATSLSTLVEMVNADLGVTFLPEMALDAGLLRGTAIQTLPMPDQSFRTIGLAWRSGSSRREEFELLADLIRANH